MNKNWYVYMLKLNDGSLYTGITTDVERRLKQHQNGKGSKIVRSKLPCELAFVEKVGDKSLALKHEHILKELPHSDKVELCKFQTFLKEKLKSGKIDEAYRKVYGEDTVPS